MDQELKTKRSIETMKLLYQDKGFELDDEELKQLVDFHKRKTILIRSGLLLLLAIVLVVLLILHFR